MIPKTKGIEDDLWQLTPFYVKGSTDEPEH